MAAIQSFEVTWSSIDFNTIKLLSNTPVERDLKIQIMNNVTTNSYPTITWSGLDFNTLNVFSKKTFIKSIPGVALRLNLKSAPHGLQLLVEEPKTIGVPS